MNAVDETLTDQDRMAIMTHDPTTKRLLNYLPPKTMSPNMYDPEIIRLSFARDIVATYDGIFER